MNKIAVHLAGASIEIVINIVTIYSIHSSVSYSKF